jgi:hypothetical protein
LAVMLETAAPPLLLFFEGRVAWRGAQMAASSLPTRLTMLCDG